MSIIASLAGCEHGSTICFEIDWETGEISDPFIRFSHEQGSCPERVWHGRAAQFMIGRDVLVSSDWERLKALLVSMVEDARKEFSTTTDDNFNEKGRFTEEGQDLVLAIEHAVQEFDFDDQVGIFDPADFFYVAHFDENGDSCSSTLAVRATISTHTSKDAVELKAFTSDSELESISEMLRAEVDEGVLLNQDVGEWLEDLRQEFRAEDEQWGELREALEALIEADDERVRYKSQHPKYNPQGAKTILIATCPHPAPSQFEPAILDVTGEAFRQWWRAGLDFPSEHLQRAKKHILSSAQHEAEWLLRDSLSQAESESAASDLQSEIDRLEGHLARLKEKLATFSPDRAEARHAALARAYARLDNAFFAVNGPGFSLDMRREGAQRALGLMLRNARGFLPATADAAADDWVVGREQAGPELAKRIGDACAADPDNRVAALVRHAAQRFVSLCEAAQAA